MAEADPLRRVQSAARRAAGPVSVETQKRWYRDDLHQDLGLDVKGQAQRARKVARKPWLSGAKLLCLFLLAAVLSVGVFAVHLAREGRLDALIGATEPPRPDSKWMGGVKESATSFGDAVKDAVGETSAPPSNFFESSSQQSPDAPAAVVPSTSDEESDASGDDSPVSEEPSEASPS
jgi:hypothetical protein